MFLPLMPSGVEHAISFSCTFTPVPVFLPLMPSGVEHHVAKVTSDEVVLGVFLPLMPSGVEHEYFSSDRSGGIWCSYL